MNHFDVISNVRRPGTGLGGDPLSRIGMLNKTKALNLVERLNKLQCRRNLFSEISLKTGKRVKAILKLISDSGPIVGLPNANEILARFGIGRSGLTGTGGTSGDSTTAFGPKALTDGSSDSNVAAAGHLASAATLVDLNLSKLMIVENREEILAKFTKGAKGAGK